MKFTTIDDSIKELKNGSLLLVVDDKSDNGATLVAPASKITTEMLSFMTNYGRGIIKLAVTKDKFQRLSDLKPDLKNEYNDVMLSLDSYKVKNGVSFESRIQTIYEIMQDDAKFTDFKKNGHVLVMPTREGGVLKRADAGETIVDLSDMAGLVPAGVYCEVLDDAGNPISLSDLENYSEMHSIPVMTIADLIAYRRKQEKLVVRVADAKMPTIHGDFQMIGYINKLNNEHHVALVKGDITTDEPVLIRVHSECLTGDAFGSQRCDCGEQLQSAMDKINEEGRGIILYMRQEGRGIGLINKIKAYNLQDQGMDTVEANLALGFPDDLRDYGIGAQMLVDLGVKKVRLMTNNPRKIKGLSGYGIEILEREPIQMNHNERNEYYLKTKKEKLGHMLSFEESE